MREPVLKPNPYVFKASTSLKSWFQVKRSERTSIRPLPSAESFSICVLGCPTSECLRIGQDYPFPQKGLVENANSSASPRLTEGTFPDLWRKMEPEKKINTRHMGRKREVKWNFDWILLIFSELANVKDKYIVCLWQLKPSSKQNFS